MNRPDLDAIERMEAIRKLPLNEGAAVRDVIAYARRLEANQSDLRRIVEGCDARISELEAARTVLPGEVFDQILNDISEGEIEALNRRISELETALEALVPGGGAVFTATDFENAARVLRKGEQP